MKLFYILSLFLSLAFFVSCNDDNDDSNKSMDCDISAFIRENYSHDAKQLYFDEIFNDPQHPNYTQININENEVEDVLRMIQAVYDLDVPERDTVFVLNDIHSYMCYGFHNISLRVDTQDEAIENLSQSIIPTGNAALDELLNTYAFDSVDLSYGYPQFPWLTIHTENEYNFLPILPEFQNLNMIENTEFNIGCVGDGNSISINRSATPQTITFSIGSGDCPAGCIYHKYWEFAIQDCEASFVRSYED